MAVLIVGDSCGALAATRELAKAGWTVGIGSNSRIGWASASRWSSRWHRIPPPLGDHTEFVEEINRVAKKHNYELVFGAGDAEVLAMSANRERLIPLLPYGTHPTVLSVFDKLELAELTVKAGLRAPVTRSAGNADLSEFDFPVVVKSRLHWNPGTTNQKTRVKNTIAYNHDDAVQHAEIMQSVGAEPLFQEFIPGHVETFVALTDRTGKILSQHVQRTTHEHSSESGISARATSVLASEEFTQKVQNLLTDINWFGIASIQFLQPNDGPPVLIDFNGRMYGSLVFANACGVRAMENWARLASGRDIAPAQELLGLRYQALEGDLRRAMKVPGMGRISELGSCLAEIGRSVHPVMSWSDPMPTLHYLVRSGLRLFGQWHRDKLDDLKTKDIVTRPQIR
jgi:predicted ATP-grasp superfamily ATP-dependent carboligase